MTTLVPIKRERKNIGAVSPFSNMLDDFFNDSFTFWPARANLAPASFKLDVAQSDTEYTIHADLPGVKKQDISLDFADNKLMIQVKHEENTEQKTPEYVHRERVQTAMSRTIVLPDAQADGIKAKLEDGVLCVTLPKKQVETAANKIEIE